MAFLKADKILDFNGIKVNQKILPAKLKPNRLLTTTDHSPKYVTIHNTADIDQATGTTDAEQYARATHNNAMGGVTVHFYIDGSSGDSYCWQLLYLDEIGYHAADGYNGTGNCQSIAIEVIEKSGTTTEDKLAEDRAARLTAFILNKYGLTTSAVKKHKDWYSKKNCPAYIIPHWSTFIATVEKYLKELQTPKTTTTTDSNVIYKIQVGAFSKKENAEAYVKKLKEAGFEGFITEVKKT